MSMEIVAEGLRFPEGPIAMPDGSVIVVEIAGGSLSRVYPTGTVEVIADCGGGPNGAALGPDGRVYVCNNGGFDDQNDAAGHFAEMGMPIKYHGGSIYAVDLNSGGVEVIYTAGTLRSMRWPRAGLPLAF
jgi:gluconolactonase